MALEVVPSLSSQLLSLLIHTPLPTPPVVSRSPVSSWPGTPSSSRQSPVTCPSLLSSSSASALPLPYRRLCLLPFSDSFSALLPCVHPPGLGEKHTVRLPTLPGRHLASTCPCLHLPSLNTQDDSALGRGCILILYAGRED